MLRLKVLEPEAVDLNDVEIATPCTVSWDSLAGDNRIRYCGHCRQSVYNIEALGRPEALRLIAGGEGRLCLRIFRRADGTVVTADCWSRLRLARGQGLVPFLVMVIVLGWAHLVAIGLGISNLRRLVDATRFAGTVPIPAHLIPQTIAESPPSETRDQRFEPFAIIPPEVEPTAGRKPWAKLRPRRTHIETVTLGGLKRR